MLLTSDKQSIIVIDRPFYCSSLTDKCTSMANVLKNTYQKYFYREGEIVTRLIISGGTDTYERTFPKFE